jgi:hypothetical protein
MGRRKKPEPNTWGKYHSDPDVDAAITAAGGDWATGQRFIHARPPDSPTAEEQAEQEALRASQLAKMRVGDALAAFRELSSAKAPAADLEAKLREAIDAYNALSREDRAEVGGRERFLAPGKELREAQRREEYERTTRQANEKIAQREAEIKASAVVGGRIRHQTTNLLEAKGLVAELRREGYAAELRTGSCDERYPFLVNTTADKRAVSAALRRTFRRASDSMPTKKKKPTTNLEANVKHARGNLRLAKREAKARQKEATARCKAQRGIVSERANRARIALRDAIAAARASAREFCSSTRSHVAREDLEKLTKLSRKLEETRKTLEAHRPFCPSSAGTCRIRTAEEEDEVRNNIDDPGLLVVWQTVKHKIKPGPRRSRTEAFFEWVAEHPSEVLEIQDRDASKWSQQLMRRQRTG